MKKLMIVKFLVLVLLSSNTFAAGKSPKKMAKILFASALNTFGYTDKLEGVDTKKDLIAKMESALKMGVSPSELLAIFDEETAPGSPSYEKLAFAYALESRKKTVEDGIEEVKTKLKALKAKAKAAKVKAIVPPVLPSYSRARVPGPSSKVLPPKEDLRAGHAGLAFRPSSRKNLRSPAPAPRVAI